MDARMQTHHLKRKLPISAIVVLEWSCQWAKDEANSFDVFLLEQVAVMSPSLSLSEVVCSVDWTGSNFWIEGAIGEKKAGAGLELGWSFNFGEARVLYYYITYLSLSSLSNAIT